MQNWVAIRAYRAWSSRTNRARFMSTRPWLALRGPAGPVRHAADRNDFRAQLLDGGAMAHGGLSDQRKGIVFGKRASAHHLQHRGEDDAPGADAIFQLFDVGGFGDASL